jgi:hypothetical protein
LVCLVGRFFVFLGKRSDPRKHTNQHENPKTEIPIVARTIKERPSTN